MSSKRNIQILLFFLRDKNKKQWFQIIKEFWTLCSSNKELPVHYISHLLYRKNVTNYNDYLSLKENKQLLQWSHVQAQEQIPLVENKLLFEQLLSKNNIPTPKIIFHNSQKKFTYDSDFYSVENRDDFVSFLTRVFDEKQLEYLFCKPIDGGQGRNIFRIDKHSIQGITDDLTDLVLSNSFIFQELVLQHEDLKRINPSSVNSCRIVTYKNKKNEVEILSGFIRFGRKGAILDNAHVGGIAVPFNKHNGKMHAEGLQLIDHGGGVFYKHPDSGIRFDNYQIPIYNQAKSIVAKASSLLKFPLMGWDVALTPRGPVILEANHNFHLLLSDRMEKGLKRNPNFKRVVEQLSPTHI